MNNSQEVRFPDMKWVPLEGRWTEEGKTGLQFIGREFDPPVLNINPQQGEPPQRYVEFGSVIFNKSFDEGRISVQVEFDDVDHRSQAGILVRYDPATKDMLAFVNWGGGLKWEPDASGFQYRLARWGSPSQRTESDQGIGNASKVWTPIFQVGWGANLQPKRPYDLEIVVRGSLSVIYVDGVEVGKSTLPDSPRPGNPFGLFCGTHSKVHFRNISVTAVAPKAFVVMQFNTPEYEALFKDVIEPICKSEGLVVHRADTAFLPGLVIDDIKKQIAEALVVIAEITPANANVYYEVGYADALNKPLILIADAKEGLKPFDVRAYRTIFYENSIGGKNKVESDLKAYLRNIMNR